MYVILDGRAIETQGVIGRELTYWIGHTQNES